MGAAAGLAPLARGGRAAGTAPAAAPASLFVPAALADWAQRRLERLGLGDLSAAGLLGERAAICGYVSRGTVSPGGSCRLLAARDGWLALNLARDEDRDLLPAWLEQAVSPGWDAVSEAVRGRDVDALVARGREIGLAVAADEAPRGPAPGAEAEPVANPGGQGPIRPPRVVDLTSLWAGPLCGHLLQRLGAEVVKVESLRRPDGARRGPPLFFDLLNAGKASVALDFASVEGRAALRTLVESADIVIEGSRPRALRQLGLDAGALCAARPGRVWVSITAYGRGPGTENWIGYGDDVAVAAGLSAAVRHATGERRIAGDAIADPLTGIRAAALAWDAWRSGRGGLLDVSLFDSIRQCLAAQSDPRGLARPLAAGHRPLRAPAGPARALGADTAAQLQRAALSHTGAGAGAGRF